MTDGAADGVAGINMRIVRLFLTLLVAAVSVPLRVAAQTDTSAVQLSSPENLICPIILSAAHNNALPVIFFARLIWQESRFRPDEIGPLTRTGQRAQGIAQFMPDTAAEHHLFEPFNPVEALPKSGEFLAELRDEFGNLGLAAAAYNAGPQRLRDFIDGLRDLPVETRNYVLAVTGRPIEDWMKEVKEDPSEVIRSETQVGTDSSNTNCREIMMSLSHAPNLLTYRVQPSVPNWCKYLNQPNASVCGSIHEDGWAMQTPRLRSQLSVLRHPRPVRLHSSRVSVVQ